MGDSTPPPAAPPGWYPDPGGPAGQQRYWDGKQWTAVQPPPPPPADAETASTPAAKGERTKQERAQIVIGIAGVSLIAIIALLAGIASLFNEDSDSTAASTSSTFKPPAPSTSRTPPPEHLYFDTDGTYEIDDCFLCTTGPGTYQSMGARSASSGCVWYRREDLTGDLGSIIDTGGAGVDQPVRVAVKLGEYFTTQGCKGWKFIG